MVSKAFNLTSFLIRQAEQRVLSDFIIRSGIRHLLKQRLKEISSGNLTPDEQVALFREQLARHAVTEDTAAANEQHYELPPAFFQEVLGPNLKYSSAMWWTDTLTLERAEENMLKVTVDRAEIRDGMNILELGCGWGSLTFWMARHFPAATITAVTNSRLQQEFINGECARRGITNIRIVKQDVGELELDASSFDRIVSVEMFEHVRNYEELFRRLETWLVPGGKLFVHIFSHTDRPYLFEARNPSDWMARYFFTGGTMPSHGLLPSFSGGLELEEDWKVNGIHYARTLESWLEKMDAKPQRVREILSTCYPADELDAWVQRWRMFFMSCAELFAFNKGRSWGVSHYRFAKRA